MTGSTEHLKAIIDLLARNEVEKAYERVRLFLRESPAGPKANAEALLKGLRHAYHHLAVVPVHIFLRGADEALGEEIASLLRAGMDAQLQKTEEWRQTLRGMGRERYARETRALIRAKRLKDAAARIQAMAELSREDSDARSVIGYLGTTLGTLDHDQDQVDTLLDALARAPERFALTPEMVVAIDVSRKQQFARSGAIALEGREREFNRIVTQAIVDLRNRLSTDLAVGDPTEEETSKFYEDLHAMFRAYYVIGRADGLLDVTTLLVELTARDRRAVGPAVASEERLFLSLNPRQRLITVRALRRLGEIPRLVSLMSKFARTPAAEGYLVPIIEVMGGLGSREFYEFIVECYKKQDFEDPRFSCVDALGRIQNEAAADLLIRRFGNLVRSKPFDPPKRREAEAICTALGRVARSRNVTPERRNEIVAQVVSLIAEDDVQMGFRAARELFNYLPQNLDQKLIDWAMNRVVQALWGQDQRPEFARQGEGMRAVLGFRQEIVDLAVLIGPVGQESFLRAVEPLATRFSGAFLAVAEILEKIGDEQALPVLKKLIITAWMSSDEPGSKYYQETWYDTISESVKPMTRDKIIYALLFAVGNVGGIEGKKFLVETGQQVRSKQLDMPGDETGSFLMQQIVEHGREVAEERARIESSGEDAAVGSTADHPLAKVHIQEVVEMLRGKYLMATTRRTKKIPAIQEIARRRHVESLELLVEQLGEKDPLIRSAAVTALQDFAAPGARPATLKLLAQLLLDRLEQTKNDERDTVRELMRKIGPRREPFRGLIIHAYNMEPEGTPLKGELSKIIRTEGLFGAEGPGKDVGPDAADGFADIISTRTQTAAAEEQSSAEEKAKSGIDAKREYFVARKAWLDGGKRGEPPVPPEGL